jgi:hypothetical protein
MSWFELSGPQIVELTELTAKVFDRPSFASMLLQLNFDLDRIVDTGHPERDIEDVIKKSNREGWIPRLIVAIKKARPNRPDVQAYGPSFNVDVVEDLFENDNLESLLELANQPLDADAWSKRLREVMSQVCRIEKDGKSYGTGFLVGPRAVLTSYHVLQSCLNCGDTPPNELPDGLLARFDFHAGEGRPCTFDRSDWLIDFLPPSPMDDVPDPKPDLPGRDELDFALLQLGNSEGKERGWLEPTALKLKPGDPLFILHYPGDQAMQLSLDTKAVQRVDGIGPRIRYRTNTIPGSSGSPCFTADLHLIALHQGTDPRKSNQQYNQGVPLSAIARILNDRWNDNPAKRASLPWLDSSKGIRRPPRGTFLFGAMSLISAAGVATGFGIGRVETPHPPNKPPEVFREKTSQLPDRVRSLEPSLKAANEELAGWKAAFEKSTDAVRKLETTNADQRRIAKGQAALDQKLVEKTAQCDALASVIELSQIIMRSYNVYREADRIMNSRTPRQNRGMSNYIYGDPDIVAMDRICVIHGTITELWAHASKVLQEKSVPDAKRITQLLEQSREQSSSLEHELERVRSDPHRRSPAPGPTPPSSPATP